MSEKHVELQEPCDSVDGQSTYRVSILTDLVVEDLGEDTGFLLQSGHTGENLRATLHHVCWNHTRNHENTQPKKKIKGTHGRRYVSFKRACHTRTMAVRSSSPILATEAHGKRVQEEYKMPPS